MLHLIGQWPYRWDGVKQQKLTDDQADHYTVKFVVVLNHYVSLVAKSRTQ